MEEETLIPLTGATMEDANVDGARPRVKLRFAGGIATLPEAGNAVLLMFAATSLAANSTPVLPSFAALPSIAGPLRVGDDSGAGVREGE